MYGELTDPPSLHAYTYAKVNPLVWIDLDGQAEVRVFGLKVADVPDEVIDLGLQGTGYVVGLAEEGTRVVRGFVQTPLEIAAGALEESVQTSKRFLNAYREGGVSGVLEERERFIDEKVGELPVARTAVAVTQAQAARIEGNKFEEGRQTGRASVLLAEDAALVLGVRAARRGASVKTVNSLITVEGASGEAAASIGSATRSASARPSVTQGSTVSALAEMPSGAARRAPEPLPLVAAPARARLSGDLAVNSNPPGLLPTTRPIGTSPTQNAALQAEIKQAIADGATNVRVNQQQVNALGERVGRNRPDLQYTRADGTRVYVEYDRSSSGRGRSHLDRLLANDPNGVVVTKRVD